MCTRSRARAADAKIVRSRDAQCNTMLTCMQWLFYKPSQLKFSTKISILFRVTHSFLRLDIFSSLCCLNLSNRKRFPSLQNRRISGASAIHESAREARERARSAKPESSACSHTIVYALPTVRLANGLCWLVTLHHVVLECFFFPRRNTITYSDLNQQQIDSQQNCSENLTGNTVQFPFFN